MHIAGLTLAILGGGWTAVWAAEAMLARAGIHQAFGGVSTEEARRKADALGKRPQQRMLTVFRRGLIVAVPVAIAGLVLAVASAK